MEKPGFSRMELDTTTVVKEIAKRTPSFAPGSKQAYSNAGYILLGIVIEKVTSKPWHETLDELILRPSGLSRTGYGLAAKIIPGRASGYSTNTPGRKVANAPYISATTPGAAGALVSTVDDPNKWMSLLSHGKVISRAGFVQMITPTRIPEGESANPYGFGMYVWKVRGETVVGHTGQTNGFASVLAYLPSRNITIIALGNNDEFDAQNFGRRVAAIALGNPYPILVSVTVPPSDLETLPGRYQDGSGIREIVTKDDRLYSRRAGPDPYPLQLIPMDAFILCRMSSHTWCRSETAPAG